MTDKTTPEITVRRHPIRGAFWGVLVGFGAALHLLAFAIIPFGAWPLLAAPITGAMLLGIVWGRFGRPRRAKGLPAGWPSRTSPKQQQRPAADMRGTQVRVARAARAANKELHTLAAAAADDTMTAALLEAENDAYVTPRHGVEPSMTHAAPITAERPDPASAVQPGDPSAAASDPTVPHEQPVTAIAEADDQTKGSLSSVLATSEALPASDGPLSLTAPLPTASEAADGWSSALVVDTQSPSPVDAGLSPRDGDDVETAASELEIQLEAALSAAMAVTTGAR